MRHCGLVTMKQIFSACVANVVVNIYPVGYKLYICQLNPIFHMEKTFEDSNYFIQCKKIIMLEMIDVPIFGVAFDKLFILL